MPAAHRLLALCLALGAANPAIAQDFPTVLPNDYVLKDILNQQRIEASIGTRPTRPVPRAQPNARPAPAPTNATTGYRPSPAVSARVRQQFVATMQRAVGEPASRQIAAALQTGDPVQNWSQIVGSDGLRPGDTADALASYWILNWLMANGADSNRAQALAVRGQLRTILLANPSYTRLSDAGRQEMAETLMLNFLLQHAAYSDAVRRGDRATQRRLGDAAATRFRTEMGLDLRRLKLTDAGFALGTG